MTFEIDFNKTKVDMAALYEFTEKTKMKFVFTNFRIQVSPSIIKSERFTYDAKEFMVSVQQLDKEN